mmetsp:Transcript_35138/g.108880  ORF Transcript_35138/g.108880 Transcript_35138/m.108880 type:complete len:263 (-) Transcript_35138:424-1212(-)
MRTTYTLIATVSPLATTKKPRSAIVTMDAYSLIHAAMKSRRFALLPEVCSRGPFRGRSRKDRSTEEPLHLPPERRSASIFLARRIGSTTATPSRAAAPFCFKSTKTATTCMMTIASVASRRRRRSMERACLVSGRRATTPARPRNGATASKAKRVVAAISRDAVGGPGGQRIWSRLMGRSFWTRCISSTRRPITVLARCATKRGPTTRPMRITRALKTQPCIWSSAFCRSGLMDELLRSASASVSIPTNMSCRAEHHVSSSS